MTTAKHTPGPWIIVDRPDRSGHVHKIMAGSHVFAHVGGHGGDAEQEANARLIAAAPTLLAACEAVLPMIESDDRDYCNDSKLRKLLLSTIASAKGGAA